MKLLKRILIWAGIGLLSLILLCITVLGLFLCWMKWSGDRDWKTVQAELHANGEKLTLQELVPPPPPDSENFYADPMWQELADLVQVTRDSIYGEVQMWEPRIRSEKLTINRWITPLTPSEKQQIQELITNEQFSKTGYEERLFEIKNLNQELYKTADPVRKKKLAQLQLELLQPSEHLLSRVSELLKRPSAYFPPFYRNISQGTFPEVTSLLRLSEILSCRCNAELALDNHAAAAEDVLGLLQLSHVESRTPLLIFHLLRGSSLGQAMTPINLGIETHQWSEGELAEFQQNLENIDLSHDLCFSFRGERASFNSRDVDSISEDVLPGKQVFVVKLLTRLCAELLIDGRGYFNESYQRLIDALLQSESAGMSAANPVFDSQRKDLNSHPVKAWLNHFFGNADWTIQGTVECHTQLTQTLIACALERYRLAHGSYPGALDALIPEYLSSIPKEPTTGHPMHYLLIKDGDFLLWAPGWKLMTLNGKPGQYNGEGDIVWNMPIPRTSRN